LTCVLPYRTIFGMNGSVRVSGWGDCPDTRLKNNSEHLCDEIGGYVWTTPRPDTPLHLLSFKTQIFKGQVNSFNIQERPLQYLNKTGCWAAYQSLKDAVSRHEGWAAHQLTFKCNRPRPDEDESTRPSDGAVEQGLANIRLRERVTRSGQSRWASKVDKRALRIRGW